MVFLIDVTVKHGMVDLILVLNYLEVKSEAIPVYIYQGHISTIHWEEKG